MQGAMDDEFFYQKGEELRAEFEKAGVACPVLRCNALIYSKWSTAKSCFSSLLFGCRIMSSASRKLSMFGSFLSGNTLIFLRIKTVKKGAELALYTDGGFKFMTCETSGSHPGSER